MKLSLPRTLSTILLAALSAFCLFKGFSVVHSQYKTIQELPRNEELSLFDPHRPGFACEIEASKVPPIDAQADAWFREAQALDDPDMWEEDRDYKKIVQLTRQAAERQHWKAMVNLATLYLEKRDPPHGEMEALALVEQAMRLGIPAAYDRMGTYYMNGVGVPGDATKAFAFWQKAAEMGNPQAMAYLGGKMAATWDSPRDGFWANIPVARKMLECSLAQGYGPAAYSLYYVQAWPRAADGKIAGPRTTDTRAAALMTLHQGVKFGCSKCARDLSSEFRNPHDLADMLVPFLDSARSERYGVLNDALDSNPLLRFPNLDKVLPLPPAALPPWNGEKQMLIDAAKGIMPRPSEPKASTASQQQGRQHLDAAYDLRPSDDKTIGTEAPFAGYWQATAPAESAQLQTWLASVAPGLYQPGEAFDIPRYPQEMGRAIQGLVWQHFLTVRHSHGAVEPLAAAGMAREIVYTEPHRSCDARTPCPVTGTWQPWLPLEHPLRHAVNQPWRQVWVTVGQAFPELHDNPYLQLDPNDLKWNLLDSAEPRLA
ncbi:tetratricopeptide repeat protein [Massilia brevitalea]|uniref:tetratricopeptide repeat protein n=1 Tax=Massilia brevitalea TaxID=442526 RepID=UPI002739D493|nr:tetratricopeptide repeat protein [Massilia brevitalea]